MEPMYPQDSEIEEILADEMLVGIPKNSGHPLHEEHFQQSQQPRQEAAGWHQETNGLEQADSFLSAQSSWDFLDSSRDESNLHNDSSLGEKIAAQSNFSGQQTFNHRNLSGGDSHSNSGQIQKQLTGALSLLQSLGTWQRGNNHQFQHFPSWNQPEPPQQGLNYSMYENHTDTMNAHDSNQRQDSASLNQSQNWEYYADKEIGRNGQYGEQPQPNQQQSGSIVHHANYHDIANQLNQQQSGRIVNHTNYNDIANILNGVIAANSTTKNREVSNQTQEDVPKQEVIDLLDHDENSDGEPFSLSTSTTTEQPPEKRQRTSDNESTAAIQAFQSRNTDIPSWMKTTVVKNPKTRIQPGRTLADKVISNQPGSGIQAFLRHASDAIATSGTAGIQLQQNQQGTSNLHDPEYIRLPEGFVPTWKTMMPDSASLRNSAPSSQPVGQERRFQLSLLNINEFTIQGLSPRFDLPPTPVAGLGVAIRKISRSHGKAIFDQTTNKEEEEEGGTDDKQGRWRIPLGAYSALFSHLAAKPKTHVIGIPPHQLQIASLERARQEKGYPSVDNIVQAGVPLGLASALAPFQRGGVDFVVAKKGRALIADEMGLGKTVQAIASMSVYIDEWPLLVLTPSSARYHWESEFNRWLGVDSPVNSSADTPKEKLIKKSQVQVLSSSKDAVIPNNKTLVVICSYGLAPALLESGGFFAGQFKCAIVDESHMLRNKATKRTTSISPLLSATTRCVLLSGTPALARPAELWPQLTILGTEQHGWWSSEEEFFKTYVKHGNSRTRAELHALLTGTVMIRRLKCDILKSMKPKQRQKAQLNVVNMENRAEFKQLLAQLSAGNGELAKLTRKKEVKEQISDVYDVRAKPVPDQHAEKLDKDRRYGEKSSEVEGSEHCKRANVLSRLYSLTGEVKIPVIADMLNRWLDDRTKGKICIFAHHLHVLDSVGSIANLSNQQSSGRKYIRIDGSTLPKSRQEQINNFQNDPTIRVALLGITAAGVAVTLTASSTVWFAELFWTPAIMIQAEDRCHRIGQQGQVECVYFVGKGTLDDVLWKLVEKKFQQLGEFVEGKEKEKLVVHKIWNNANEFHSIFDTRDCMNSEDEDSSSVFDVGQDLVPLESSLVHDIEELGEDERRMLKSLDAEDDDADSTNNDMDAKPIARSSSPSNELGCSQEAAITLSDDEDVECTDGESTSERSNALFNQPLEGCRLFRVTFQSSELGLELMMVEGRAVVKGLKEARIQRFGFNSKPSIGDVIVMIGKYLIPFVPHDKTGTAIESFVSRTVSKRQSFVIVFAEHPDIRGYVINSLQNRRTSHRRQQVGVKPPPSLTSNEKESVPHDIIEID